MRVDARDSWVCILEGRVSKNVSNDEWKTWDVVLGEQRPAEIPGDCSLGLLYHR